MIKKNATIVVAIITLLIAHDESCSKPRISKSHVLKQAKSRKSEPVVSEPPLPESSVLNMIPEPQERQLHPIFDGVLEEKIIPKKYKKLIIYSGLCIGIVTYLIWSGNIKLIRNGLPNWFKRKQVSFLENLGVFWEKVKKYGEPPLPASPLPEEEVKKIWDTCTKSNFRYKKDYELWSQEKKEFLEFAKKNPILDIEHAKDAYKKFQSEKHETYINYKRLVVASWMEYPIVTSYRWITKGLRTRK